MINEWLSDLLATFFDPSKRVFWGYLLSALFIAMFWLGITRKLSFREICTYVFSSKVWWSTSAKADYKVFFLNKIIMLLLSPLLLVQLTLATTIFYTLFEWFPSRPLVSVGWSDGYIVIVFTLCYFLLDDFMRFYVHRLLHRIPALWAFHKVHHSAETLTPMTVFRTHPVEAIVFSLRSTFVQGVAIGGFVFFIGDKADLWMVLGAMAFTFVFNVLGANLRHSSVAIYYWRWLERIFMSPAQHQIHHSVEPQHYDKNYGVVLSIWDMAFGCHHYSEKNKDLRFGLLGETKPRHTLYGIYCTPFVESFGAISRSVQKIIFFCCQRFRKTVVRVSLFL